MFVTAGGMDVEVIVARERSQSGLKLKKRKIQKVHEGPPH
jgi:hypothetical protein